MYKTKKFFVVLMEFVGGLSLGLLALCLPLPGYFRYSVALLAVVAFCSSTHDIAADGLYIASLTREAAGSVCGMAGWILQHRALRFARRLADSRRLSREPHAGSASLDDDLRQVGITLVVLSLFHARVLPTGGEERHSDSLQQMLATFWDVVVEFLQASRNIWFLLLFVFLYRAGEGQVVKIGPLFLKAARAAGWPRSEHGAVWNDLRHVRHGGIHPGQHPGRIFCGMAGSEARAAAADPGDEPADADLFLSQHRAAHAARC